jgi:hypothetical protein
VAAQEVFAALERVEDVVPEVDPDREGALGELLVVHLAERWWR